MSPRARVSAAKQRNHAPIFAALGDKTRLSIVRKLAIGQPHSISELADGTTLTRQAITKHLLVLQNVGLVKSIRSGRENLFEFDPKPIADIREYLDLVSEQWDQALSRLKSFVEE